jgi:hypothetical protein
MGKERTSPHYQLQYQPKINISFINTLMLKQTAPARTDKNEQVSPGL